MAMELESVPRVLRLLVLGATVLFVGLLALVVLAGVLSV
jgi:hypothetical protein